jgi:hypothetical protein
VFYCEVETSFKMFVCFINFAIHGFNKERASAVLVSVSYSSAILAPSASPLGFQ